MYMYICADDTKIFQSVNNEKLTVQLYVNTYDLDQLVKWEEKWQLDYILMQTSARSCTLEETRTCSNSHIAIAYVDEISWLTEHIEKDFWISIMI